MFEDTGDSVRKNFLCLICADCYFFVSSGVTQQLLKENQTAALVQPLPPTVQLVNDDTLVLISALISMLAEKLNMTPEEAERWIVNLIRNARLDAKIDSKLVRTF